MTSSLVRIWGSERVNYHAVAGLGMKLDPTCSCWFNSSPLDNLGWEQQRHKSLVDVGQSHVRNHKRTTQSHRHQDSMQHQPSSPVELSKSSPLLQQYRMAILLHSHLLHPTRPSDSPVALSHPQRPLNPIKRTPSCFKNASSSADCMGCSTIGRKETGAIETTH